MLTYFSQFQDKRLCDIVLPGSHDAGIANDDVGDNVQTQNLNILEQAQAGVRVFDLRIAATKDSSISAAPVMLKAFHADKLLMDDTEKKHKTVFDLQGRKRDVTTTKLRGGGFGMRLVEMLQQARQFIRDNNEFLILKFDKCNNWELVAEVCVTELGDDIFRGNGSLNEKTVFELRKSIVVVFTPKGQELVAGRGYNSMTGIFGCKSLTKGGDYDSDYDGLQYIGKGGTPAFDGDSDMGKIATNIEKQGKLMSIGAKHPDPRVMGMMYWTTTGLDRSIRERNQTMWGDDNRPTMLTKLWTEGFEEAITQRLPAHLEATNYATGSTLKAYMPNIVMIDFASLVRCRFIYELNIVAATMLTQTAQKVEKARKLVAGRGAKGQRAGVPF